jgi:hypothetical protein
MSFTTTLPAAILETILTRLAILFLTGANGDTAAARRAAAQMLGAYHPKTEDELRLAANIVIFSFQALEALSQAAGPDMPLARILRLRGGAVSLSREAAKSERRLGQLQKSAQQPVSARPRTADIQPAAIQPAPAQPEPKTEKAAALIQDTATIAAAAKTKGLTWTQAYEERQRDLRIAASLKRAEARIAALSIPAIPGAIPGHQPLALAI